MKKAIQRQFIQCGRKRLVMFEDDTIALIPREYAHRVSHLDGACSMIYDVYDREQKAIAGEIALRIGEGASLFYLGHIGYHIDPPFRGKHEALHACRLCLPVFCEMGMNSFVITTDEDNIPSILTCERLGCLLESTVDVPGWCRAEYGISARKRRYVFTFSKA